jgi:hypothetical protein
MADFTLSVEFDAKDVKTGAEETNRAVASIGAEAEKTTKKTRDLGNTDLGKPAKSAEKASTAIRQVGDEAQKAERRTKSLATTDLTPLKKQLDAIGGGSASVADLSGHLGSLTAAAGPAGIALTLLTTLIAGAAAAAAFLLTKLIESAKAFADFGVQVGKAQAMTGLSAETMSALGYQVTKTGGNYDVLLDALVNYQKLIGEANNGNKEAIEKTKRLGIDTVAAAKNMDGALRQTLQTIVDMPAGIDRTNAAIDAFGDGGKNLLPFLDTFNGDLDGLIKKGKELGVVLSEEDVKAAQEFNRAYGEVQALIKGIIYTVGREALPTFKSFFEDLRGWLQSSQDFFRDWARNIGDDLRGLKGFWDDLNEAKKEYFGGEGGILNTVAAVQVSIDPITRAAQWLGEEVRKRGNLGRLQDTLQNLRNFDPTAALKATGNYNLDPNGAANDTAKKMADMAAAQAEALRTAQAEAARMQQEMTKRDLAAQIGLYEDHFRKLGQLYDEKFRAITDKFKETNDTAQYQASFDQLRTWYAGQLDGMLPLYKTLVDRQTQQETLGQYERQRVNEQTQDKINSYRRLSAEKARLVELGITEETKKQAKERERIAKAEAERRRGVLQGLEDQIRQAGRVDESGFRGELQSIAERNNLAGSAQVNAYGAQVDVSRGDFVNKIDQFFTEADRVKERGIAVAEGLDAVERSLGNYLATVKTIGPDGLTKQAFADIPKTIAYLTWLREEIEKNDAAARAAHGLEQYHDLMQNLDQTLLQLNNELAGNTELTEANRVAQMLSSAAYKDLTDAQREALKARAAEIDQARAALAAQREAQEQYREFADFVRGSLQVLADQGFGAFFKHIFGRFKQMLLDMAAEWVSSKIFNLFRQGGGATGAGGGGGSFWSALLGAFGVGNRGTGGGSAAGSAASAGARMATTPSFNPNLTAGNLNGQFFTGGGFDKIMAATVATTGNGSSGRNASAGGIGGGMFSPIPNLLNGGKPSALGGTLGGIGAIATMVGGFLPGKLGNVVSMAGTGMSIGAMFGPWGAAAGAAIGAIVGLFMGDPKKKIDKKENMPKLQQGFTDAMNQLRALLADKNALYSDPTGAVQKAMDLRAEIASGFGIQFQSKKYRAQAQTQIGTKLREADDIIKQIKDLASVYGIANKIDGRLETSFATGVYMSGDFLRQYKDFKRRNGMLAGAWTGKDTLPSMLAPGEMVLNPSQIRNVQANAGFDVFKGAGIPHYATGVYVAPPPSSTRSETSPQGAVERQPITVQIMMNNSGLVESDIKGVLVNGLRDTDVQVELVKAVEKGQSRKR